MFPELCKREGSKDGYYGELKDEVSKELSPQDTMFQGNQEHYYGVGISSMKSIMNALYLAGREPGNVLSILDFACGHGRVNRFLAKAFPEAKITACDVDKAGVDFCAKTFGSRPVYSDPDPTKIPISEQFDLIWCSSLLTHLKSEDWERFIKFFENHLNDKGIVIFSTHGRYTAYQIASESRKYAAEEDKMAGLIDDYNRGGFGYFDYYNMDSYGLSLSSPAYVMSELQKFPSLKILFFSERALDNHQDVVALIKEKELWSYDSRTPLTRATPAASPGIGSRLLTKTRRWLTGSRP